MIFNIADYKGIETPKNRYDKHIKSLEDKGYETQHIKTTVKKSVEKVKRSVKSFVIYGEPQSGKTELMIALTARLLDEGNKIIIVLLNDNVGLLEQNLGRFAQSGITPDPKNYKEILDKGITISGHDWIVFCKKNSSDLTKIIERFKYSTNKIIIDDESDYASPNGKVNKSEKTKINELVSNLIGNDGQYIGVTATPARLDLNNTFDNQNTEWVNFTSHGDYTGQDVFFPIDSADKKIKYSRTFLPDNDEPKYLRMAFFRFLIHSTYLNTNPDGLKKNYSMLIHTSGKKLDHDKDYKDIIKIIEVLKNESHIKYNQYVKSIYETANEKFREEEAKCITQLILENRNNIKVMVINSNKDKENLEKSTNPSAYFTIAIGGNIISRGVTFNNLLSMFFTRTVKGKLQQDTYIQRARMFGNRGPYLKYFDLTIPKELYVDWHTCFVYHKLALESVKNGNIPVWIEGKRTKVASSGSIDQNTVEMSSGEMSYEKFNYNKFIDELDEILEKDNLQPIAKLTKLQELLGVNVIPKYLINFINNNNSKELVIHASTDIYARGDDTDKENISRDRGFIGHSELEKVKHPNAIHHIKIFFNSSNNFARIFYKYTFPLKFLRNLR